MNRLPDIEAIVEFNDTKMTPAKDGYRLAHLVTNNYLTTRIHHYCNTKAVSPNGTTKGTIKFLCQNRTHTVRRSGKE